jgi:hypothetical protein
MFLLNTVQLCYRALFESSNMAVERAKKGKALIIKDVGSLIITIRNQKVIVDRDLAEIYGVETRRLNEQVKRNPERFPEVQTYEGRGRLLASFKIANCDLKAWEAYQISTIRIH